MVKKIIYIVIVYLIFVNLICCSKTKDKNIYKIDKDILLINNRINIDLKYQIEEILKILGDKYSEDFMPGYKEYSLINYPLSFLINNKTNKIETILFKFYDSKENELINEIIINNLKLERNISFEEIKKLLYKNNINYDLEELTDYYNFSVKNHRILSIRYMKENLKGPQTIEIQVN